MSDEPLTNAAVEFMRAAHLFLNAMERDEFVPRVSDDFVAEDRRSGINYGIIVDTAVYVEVMKMSWDLGSGRPTWSMPEVIAVRGERIAAMTTVTDYGNGMHLARINCVRFDPQLQLQQRVVLFDVDAREAAIALLDEWHAEIDD